MQRVAVQPVSVALWASRAFKNYGGGVFTGPCDSGTHIIANHAVLAVGCGMEDGHKYWLVKNSWGLSWGESGYIKLARASGQRGRGLCNLYSTSSYPIMSQPFTTPAPTPAPAPAPTPAPTPMPTPAPTPSSCCSGCPGSAFCSPISRSCYTWKRRDYYEACPSARTPVPPPQPRCGSSYCWKGWVCCRDRCVQPGSTCCALHVCGPNWECKLGFICWPRRQ